MEFLAPTVEKCLSLSDEISNALNSTGYVIFRNADWSTDQADDFMVRFSKHHGWRVTHGTRNKPHWVYLEDHKYTLALMDEQPGTEEMFIHWHAEHPNLEFPQHGALWHMVSKSGHPDSGQTGFLDNANLYKGLSSDDQKFLERCEAVMTPIISKFDPIELASKIIVNTRGEKLIVFKSYGDISVNFIRPIVQVHARTGKKCIRFNSHYNRQETGDVIDEGVMSKMIFVDGRLPTIEEEKRAERLMIELARRIYGDTSIHTWVKWQEGDLILADLFRMTHAVRGGFKQGERLFRGIWAFDDLEYLPEDPKQIDEYSNMPDHMYVVAEH